MPIIAPYRPPTLSADAVRLTNCLLIRSSPFCGTLSGAVSATAVVTPLPPAFIPEVTLTLRVNDARWFVGLSSLDFLRLHPIFSAPEIQATDVRLLPDELKTALIETLSAPLSEALSQSLGTSVTLESADYRPVTFSASAGLTITLTRDAVSHVVNLSLQPTNSAALDDVLPRLAVLPRRQEGFLTEAAASVPLRFAVTAGSVLLSAEAAAALAAGDVVFPETWLPNTGKVNVSLYSDRTPVLSAEADLAQHTGTLTKIQFIPHEASMAELENLDVKLTFELEERTLSVADLKSLAPGYTFTLTSDADSPVTVRANGRPIARGRLVDVGGTLGVQITEKA